jgi:mannose-6-phosphate isomerase-like protein (cupin superfamily)
VVKSSDRNFRIARSGFAAVRRITCRIRCDAARLARFSHSNMKLWTQHSGCQIFGRRTLPRFASARTVEATMNQQTVVSKFSHVKPGDTEFKGGGLRDFFLYRDLGIASATGGQVICHLVKANPEMPPEEGTGWHKHECEFQIVIMTKGWARFMYEDKPTLVQAGDVVHQRPGITHYLYDYSPDMEYLEIVSPADFKTVDVAPFVDKVAPPTPWK